MGALVILMFQTRKLALELLLIFLEIADGLLVLQADSTLALDLCFEFMYGLLENYFVVEKLLNLPHAVADD